jgi:hypothetical protein
MDNNNLNLIKEKISHFFDKGFTIYYKKKLNTEDEIIAEIDKYLKGRDESFIHSKKDGTLFIIRKDIKYKIVFEKANKFIWEAFISPSAGREFLDYPWVLTAREVK